MSQRNKRECLHTIRPRYLKADKVGKIGKLDEYVGAPENFSKYANLLLKKGPGPKSRKKKGHRKVYLGEVVQALIQVSGDLGVRMLKTTSSLSAKRIPRGARSQ